MTRSRIRVRRALVAVPTVALALTLASCGLTKAQEPFQDAPRGVTNSSPADVIEMPDGFSNVATKCDHGNRVYVVFKNDNPYGAISVVPQDATCK